MPTTDRMPTTAANDERRRLAAVRRYDILDTPPDGAFDRVAAIAARTFGVPIATVTIVDEDRIWLKAQQGLHGGARELPREPGLCASAILSDQPYLVTDALQDRRTATNSLVRGELGLRFYAAAPIVTPDGYRLGTVNVIDTAPRQADDAQLTTLRDLASVVMEELETRLAAMRAVTTERDLRRAVEQERAHLVSVNQVLRATLLPPELPEVPGLQVSAYYHAASPDAVGGDFYDLFPLDRDRWGMFIGDVCGKGPQAAAVTSMARYSLRSAAVYAGDPITVLTRLNTLLLRAQPHDDHRFCTVLFGLLTVEAAGATLTVAGGGHPPPVLIRADGTTELLTLRGGQLLGVLPDAKVTSTTAHLSPGDALLLYTDGLTEARTTAGAMFSELGLLEAARRLAGRPAPEIIAALRDLLRGFGPGLADDTALLALTVDRPQAPPET